MTNSSIFSNSTCTASYALQTPIQPLQCDQYQNLCNTFQKVNAEACVDDVEPFDREEVKEDSPEELDAEKEFGT